MVPVGSFQPPELPGILPGILHVSRCKLGDAHYDVKRGKRSMFQTKAQCQARDRNHMVFMTVLLGGTATVLNSYIRKLRPS